MIDHHGSSMNSGHYTARVFRNGVWYYCNDEHVSVMENIDKFDMLTAYVLVYEKRK